MNNNTTSKSSHQGFGDVHHERLPLIDLNDMGAAQRAAAEAIINGPRKRLYGAFVPLVYAPQLTEPFGNLGAKLRFEGTLSDAIRELVICVVARETSNQFEWQMHAPNAIMAGVPRDVITSLAAGRPLHGLCAPEQYAVDFAQELMRHDGVSDQTFALAKHKFGEAGVVELTTLVGYFVMACWVMNVARTPGPVNAEFPALPGLPN